MNLWDGKYALLVRREFWEHRALWLAPAVVAGCALVLPLFGDGSGPGPAGGLSVDAAQRPGAIDILSGMLGATSMIALAATLGGVTTIAIIAYLLECLYAERRDRSILFWKSLPVSDAEAVLSKVVVALVVVPLFVLLLLALLYPLMLGVLWARFPAARELIGAGTFAAAYAALLESSLAWLIGMLWYAPIAAYLLLASVLARRVPLMYAMLPPVALMLIEGMLMGSANVVRFIGERLAPLVYPEWRWTMGPGRPMPSLAPDSGSPDWVAALSRPDLWIGVAVAAAMVYIVIRLRRYRDDT